MSLFWGVLIKGAPQMGARVSEQPRSQHPWPEHDKIREFLYQAITGKVRTFIAAFVPKNLVIFCMLGVQSEANFASRSTFAVIANSFKTLAEPFMYEGYATTKSNV